MNIDVRDRAVVQTTAATRLAIADRGIHRSPRDGMKGLYPCMAPRWRDHLEMFGPLPLNLIRPHPGSFQNSFLAEAVCQAMNRWDVAE